MKKFFCIFICCTVFTPLLPSQTAEKIENLLNVHSVSYEEAALFILEAADAHATYGSSVISDPAEAFRFAAEQKWLPKKISGGGSARLDAVSLLLMRSFGVKGGLFYSLFKNPHYAYRELVYMEVIQGKADPAMNVSGEALLFMVNRILSGRPESGRQEDGWQNYDAEIAIPGNM